MTRPTPTEATPLESAPAGPATRYRWVICGLLFFATTINYVDRQILSLLKPILDNELHWTNQQFGLVNSAFQASYGLSVIFFGWYIDKYGVKLGYAVSIGAWSLAALGHALVNSVGGFFGMRVALGLGEGGNFPAAIKATAQWFPRKERALATTLFNSGANFGAVLAPMVVPFIAYNLSWHWAFIIAGIAGLLWLVFWFPLFDLPQQSRRVSPAELMLIEADSPRQAATKTCVHDDCLCVNSGDAQFCSRCGRPLPAESQAGAAPSEAPVDWRKLLGERRAWSFIVGKFMTDPVWWFFLIWLPDFFKKTRGLDIKSSWVLLVGIYGIITVLSIFGGWLSGFLISRGMSVTKARKLSMLIFALCVMPIAFATRVDNWTAVLLIGLAGAAHQAWSATLFTTISDMFPKAAVAKLVGFGTASGSLGGIGFPILTGYVLDQYQNTGYTIIFAVCSLAYVLAFAVHHLLAPSFELRGPEVAKSIAE